mmetsp:Transcript_65393/g.128911  ORF Transcript_65393/g.128911 Transcript_65393/m.128911 type:complete len:205 (-) Transcript_65393:112-726(-)
MLIVAFVATCMLKLPFEKLQGITHREAVTPQNLQENSTIHSDCRVRAAAHQRNLVGAFVPQCAQDGSYAPRQCWGSTGYCWCASADGHELPATQRPPVEAHEVSVEACISLVSMCDAGIVTNTTMPCNGSAGNTQALIHCTDDGGWQALQCEAAEGPCWCVDYSGAELPATKCSHTRGLRDGMLHLCEKLRHTCASNRSKNDNN